MYIYTIFDFNMELKEILLTFISDFDTTEGIEDKDNILEVYTENEIELLLNELKERYSFNFDRRELENKNWNEIWESNFESVKINDKIGIRAVFHQPQTEVENEIIIQPKMSFGTGHHATTAQMMKAMQNLDFNQKKVLDLGSGTAILAIYAEMLGATEILAIDNDEWCFENAKENIKLNNTKHTSPKLGNIEDILNDRYDIVLANIHKNYHIEHFNDYKIILKNNGYILLSGFYESDAQAILNKALEHNLISNYYTMQDNWSCVILKNNNI